MLAPLFDGALMSESATTQSTLLTIRCSWALRWSLRAFLVLIAMIAIGMGWISYQMRMGQMHDRIAKRISTQGAVVRWKLERQVPVQHSPGIAGVNFASAFVKQKGGPDWMKRLGAESAFQRIEYIYFRGHSAKQLDALLEEIEPLGRLKGFSTDGVPVSEAQVERILNTLEIESLGISETSIGRRPMPFLRDSKLTWLSFHRTQLSDVALDDLPETLTYFDATRTRITDEGLPKFARLKNLNTLILRRTPTSREAIEKLQSEMPWCEIRWAPLTKP